MVAPITTLSRDIDKNLLPTAAPMMLQFDQDDHWPHKGSNDVDILQNDNLDPLDAPCI